MNKKIEKDVINCSRCGLCMSVCPIYKVKKTETSLLRGKFLQLYGLIKGDLKYNSKIAYNLDLCLACKKCKPACPSNIDAISIFTYIKNKYNTPYENFLYSYAVFKLKMFVLKIIYKIKYPLGRKKSLSYFPKTKDKIGYFRGCATKAMGYGFDEKSEFVCCGIPFYTKGRIDIYEKLKNKNLKLIEKYDKVVFDCATCYDTVIEYENVDKQKLIYFTDFYKDKKLKSKEKLKVTFHKPCHISLEKFLQIEEILKSIENIEYVKMEGAEDCCGFGGDFFTRHFKSASGLSLLKTENTLKTGADVVLTTCPTCLWSLKFGIKTKKAKIKAYDLAEFLKNCI